MQQNLLIVISSYVFYGWWDWRYLLLIVFTSLCSYGSGIAIGRYEGRRRNAQKYISTGNIILNLLILGVFKYYNFFAESFAGVFRGLGYQMDLVTLNIVLPVGISFYTFQALSYTIDVYQGKVKPTRDVIQFFAYISFFPQLVAGPIERATNLLPQFDKQRQFDYAQSVDGARQILWGFFKKMVVADGCAAIVNQYWNLYPSLPGMWIIVLGVLFTFQIYGDFSGYSDIAIGCSKLFGIRLMKNFDVPYFSRNISEFWRRWHISLMSWFRDYVYIPLGGGRCSRWKAMCNVLIVFLISGLWHGANWTLVIWGGYNGMLIVIANMLGCNSKYGNVVACGKLMPSPKEILQMLATFILVVVGWIIFRSDSIVQTTGFLSSILVNPFIGSWPDWNRALGFGFLLLVVEWIQRDKQHALQFSNRAFSKYRGIRWLTYYLLIWCISQFSGSSQSFIYFQF